MHILRRRVALVAVAVTAVGVAVVAPESASSAAGNTGAAVRTVTQAKGGYITKIAYPDGTVVKAYSSGPMHSAATSIRRTSRTLTADGATVTENSLSGELVPDIAGPTGKAKQASSPSTSPSAYDQLIAMGVSPTEAAEFKDPPVPQPVASSGSTGSRAASSVTPNATTDSGELWDTSCIDADFDGSHGHVHGCDWQYRVWVNGADWYMQDYSLATGTMHDTALFNPDEITGLKFGIHYSAYNVIANWDPSDTKDMGNCTTTQVSVTIKLFNLSRSSTECPETWGVYTINNQTFTTKWDGKGNGPNDGARATHGAASVHSPPSAAPSRTLPWTVWWD
jgi:hypothetical protein